VHNAEIVLKLNIRTKNANAQTAHLFFVNARKSQRLKNKRAVSFQRATSNLLTEKMINQLCNTIALKSFYLCANEIYYNHIIANNACFAEHNHQNDSDDSCPITCACNCCGMTITYQPLQTFNLDLNNQISTEIISVYQSIYRFDYHSNIWQPPQLIS